MNLDDRSHTSLGACAQVNMFDRIHTSLGACGFRGCLHSPVIRIKSFEENPTAGSTDLPIITLTHLLNFNIGFIYYLLGSRRRATWVYIPLRQQEEQGGAAHI